MSFPFFEPTSSHLAYLTLSFFLISYALFSELIRNRLHLSEPPLATLTGIIFGPFGATAFDPRKWGWADNITQELTRLVLGIQVFAVGIGLPRAYLKGHWKSVLILLGPVMTFGWLVSAAIVYFVLKIRFTTALIIAACLTPTDPVLSASVLGEARFSQRVPKRLRNLLACESGCNDGISFPFLYVGLLAVTKSNATTAAKDWFLEVILWQCLLGTVLGVIIGKVANYLLRLSETRGYIQDSTFFVFYLLLAIFCVGVGSTLGVDDFLVAFSAGVVFAWDGWFVSKTEKMDLPSILDLLINSSIFVYFGAIIPWHQLPGSLTPGRMIGCVVLILAFRRIPIVLALKPWTPGIKTYSEALFCGHFGPMGVGAIFLVVESRARLESESSVPLPQPPDDLPHKDVIDVIWTVICFVVLASIMVHGISAMIMSVARHLSRKDKERAPLIGEGQERLYGMGDNDGGTITRSDDSD